MDSNKLVKHDSSSFGSCDDICNNVDDIITSSSSSRVDFGNPMCVEVEIPTNDRIC